MERKKITEIRKYLNSHDYSIGSEEPTTMGITLFVGYDCEYLPSTLIDEIREIWDNGVLVGIRENWLVIVLIID